jgi:DNA invertase Pin-like site-specific DNA recombinase
MRIAYVRVSTIEQNEERQIEGLQKHNIDKWFVEKVSGKDTNRTELQTMLDVAKAGDTIYVHDFSRLARSTKDLLAIVEMLTEREINLVSNKENIDTSTPAGKLMLTVLAAIYEFERTNMLERQAEGIEIAKRENKYANCGRKKTDCDSAKAISLIEQGYTKTEIAKILGVSRPTLNRILSDAVA